MIYSTSLQLDWNVTMAWTEVSFQNYLAFSQYIKGKTNSVRLSSFVYKVSSDYLDEIRFKPLGDIDVCSDSIDQLNVSYVPISDKRTIIIERCFWRSCQKQNNCQNSRMKCTWITEVPSDHWNIALSNQPPTGARLLNHHLIAYTSYWDNTRMLTYECIYAWAQSIREMLEHFTLNYQKMSEKPKNRTLKWSALYLGVALQQK